MEDKEKKKTKKSDEVSKLTNELALEKEKSMRIQAEMLNYKKRKEEEYASFIKYADASLISELLPVIDNFERAIKFDNNGDLSDELSKFLEGFKMIYTNLYSILTSKGVTLIDAAGCEFDPNVHEAVLTEKDESKPSGVVLEVLQKGYMYKDKVLRPAMVKVNE